MNRARYYWLLLAESHLTQPLFGLMVGGIPALPVAMDSPLAMSAAESDR
jgi:hypothetical protein